MFRQHVFFCRIFRLFLGKLDAFLLASHLSKEEWAVFNKINLQAKTLNSRVKNYTHIQESKFFMKKLYVSVCNNVVSRSFAIIPFFELFLATACQRTQNICTSGIRQGSYLFELLTRDLTTHENPSSSQQVATWHNMPALTFFNKL